MATVIGEDGKEYEVKQVEAVAAIATISALSQKELPPDAAKQIERAMVWAINKAMEDGVSDPAEINARMMKARADMKQSMYTRMNDLRSQEAAAAKEK